MSVAQPATVCAPLSAAANWFVHGVPATVTRPREVGISTRVIWVTPVSDDLPGGTDFQASRPERIAALRLDDVPSTPRGTIIEAPERGGGVVKRWEVDGWDAAEADHVRVIVRPAAEAC